MISIDELVKLLCGEYDDGGIILSTPPRRSSIGALIVVQLCKQLRPLTADTLKNRIYGEAMGWADLDFRDAQALRWGWNDWLKAGRPTADVAQLLAA